MIPSINPEPTAFLDLLLEISPKLTGGLMLFLAGMLWRNSNKDADTAFTQGLLCCTLVTKSGLTKKTCSARLMKTFCALSKSMAHFTWTSVGPGIYPNNLEENHVVKGLRIVFLPSLWNIKWIKEDKWKPSFYWSECGVEQHYSMSIKLYLKVPFFVCLLYFQIIFESNCFWSLLWKFASE